MKRGMKLGRIFDDRCVGWVAYMEDFDTRVENR
jgi:hypothetical protein